MGNLKPKRELNPTEQAIESVTAAAHAGVTSESRYEEGMNGLCQKLDRILSGNPQLTVVSGLSGIAPAYTDIAKRQVNLNHQWILNWANKQMDGSPDSKDRIALTLSLNLHELGHVLYSPALSRARQTHSTTEIQLFNALEDQRQEMLVTLEYPKAKDYFRLCNARALRETMAKLAKAGKPMPHQLYLLYYGRRHLFPTKVNVEIAQAFLNKYRQSELEFVKARIQQFMTLNLTTHTGLTDAWNIVTVLIPYWERNNGLSGFTANCMPNEGTPMKGKTEQGQQSGQVAKVMAGQSQAEKQEEKQAEEKKQKTASKAETKPEDETNEDEDGEGDGDGSESEDEAEDESESESHSHGGGKGTEDLPREGRGQQPKEIPQEIEDAIRELLDIETDTEVKVSTDLEQAEKTVNSTGTLSLPSTLQTTASSLARLFEDIAVDLREANFRNQPSGRFDLHGLAGKISAGSDKMFYRKQDDMTSDAAMGIHMAVDISGSMRSGDRDVRAINAAYIIAKAAEMAGHKTRISAFNQNVMNVKGWHSTRVWHPQCGGDTQPFPLLKGALADFRQLEAKDNIHNHAMIMITDGAWGEAGECQKEITKLRKAGVYVILIGIDFKPIQRYEYDNVTGKRKEIVYGDLYAELVVKEVNDLAKVMRETLKKLAIQISHDALRKSW